MALAIYFRTVTGFLQVFRKKLIEAAEISNVPAIKPVFKIVLFISDWNLFAFCNLKFIHTILVNLVLN